ncbi:MAG TPA: aminotransferase class IV [Chitinophagaceae bacterium]|nr:aminotransferase class IV [Chitinophagaceae bacterium]
MECINVNGKVLEAKNAFIKIDNHSFRYGDGLFETMKVIKNKISLGEFHFDRLFNGFSILKYPVPAFFTKENLEREILDLCKKNHCENMARVRLSISGGSGGLYDGDEKIEYTIECWTLPASITEWNENGLVVDVFPDIKKSCDTLSNFKSASHLPYAMAARYAKEHKWNDCLLLNTHERICDSSIANIFWIKEKNIFTPPLSEGCIAGVMRRFLIEKLPAVDYNIEQKPCTVKDLEEADEIFLTNAIRGIKWVASFGNQSYKSAITREIYSHLDELQKQ